MKLFKFRSLSDRLLCRRAIEILQKKKFWCTSLWDQNDAMEGVYSYQRGRDERDVEGVFSKKNSYKICAFSGEGAFRLPSIWGYYANGFKGMAIEIEVEPERVTKVRYSNRPFQWVTGGSIDQKVRRAITTKLRDWKSEDEYRFLVEGPPGNYEVGEITAVYFGDPYRGIENPDEVTGGSSLIPAYLRRKRRLIAMARSMGYPCFGAFTTRIDDKWVVTSGELID